MLRKPVFRVRKIRIWAANLSSSYFSETVFSGCETFKYEQYHPAWCSICWCTGIPFSGWETFKYGQCSQTIKLICWISGIAFLCCETVRYFQRYPWRGSFSDAQEFRFQAANISNTGIAVLQKGRLATSQITCFRLWNVQICAVTCYKSTIYWLWGFASSVIENFRYVQWWHETNLICWCLWIAFFGFEIFIYEYCCHA